jgi:CRISPR/Cas system-associated exonuclease Cas4 (RecB family)
MQPNKKQLYTDYLSKLEEALIADNKEWIDYILEYMYSIQLTEEERIEIDDILQEATLYAEFWENEYKDEALVQISEFKEEIGL